MLKVMVDKVAAGLYNLAVRKGDRVAIMVPNYPQYIVAFFAVQKAGGVVVQVNPMHVERKLEHILHDSGAEVIVAFDQFYPRIKNVRHLTPLKHVILFSLGQPVVGQEEGVLTAEEILATTDANPPQLSFDVVNDLAVLQYTGGTTGVSKGAMLTHRNIVANALQMTEWFQGCRYGEETVLSVLPFFPFLRHDRLC